MVLRTMLRFLRRLLAAPAGDGVLSCGVCGRDARLVVSPTGPMNANVTPAERDRLLHLTGRRYMDLCLGCAQKAGVDLRKCFRQRPGGV